MCAKEKYSWKTIIDTSGRDWPYLGVYNHVRMQPNGWVIAGPDVDNANDLIHLSDMQKVIHFDHGFYRILRIIASDLCVGVARDKDRGVELWSISEDRRLIGGVGSIHFYDPDRNLVCLSTRDDHMQLRNLDHGIINDFGVPDGFCDHVNIWYSRDVYCRSFICKEANGKEFYVPFDPVSGKECGEPFIIIGPLQEGLRYMVRPDGSECFVNQNLEKVFDLGQKRPDRLRFPERIRGIEYGIRKYICCNGKIIALRWGKDESWQSYMLDREGNILLPPGKCPRNIYSLGADRYAVKKGKKFAIANENAELMTDYIYSMAMDWDGPEETNGVGFFSDDNLCSVMMRKKSYLRAGCIDLNCNEVIPFEFGEIKYFSNGFAVATRKKGLDFWDSRA